MIVFLMYYELYIGWTLKDTIFFKKIVFQYSKSAIILRNNSSY